MQLIQMMPEGDQSAPQQRVFVPERICYLVADIGKGALGASTACSASMNAEQVLDCEGDGTVSQVIAGLDWVAQQHAFPAVVSMSLGTQDVQGSQSLDAAVHSLVHNHNITVVVAAGNQNTNSCAFSPGAAHISCIAQPQISRSCMHDVCLALYPATVLTCDNSSSVLHTQMMSCALSIML